MGPPRASEGVPKPNQILQGRGHFRLYLDSPGWQLGPLLELPEAIYQGRFHIVAVFRRKKAIPPFMKVRNISEASQEDTYRCYSTRKRAIWPISTYMEPSHSFRDPTWAIGLWTWNLLI